MRGSEILKHVVCVEEVLAKSKRKLITFRLKSVSCLNISNQPAE